MNGDELLGLMRRGVFDRDKPADREIMLSLLDQPKEMPMTWDGVPEHRNLGGDGDEPRSPADYLRNLFGGPPRVPAPSMPADPFSGITAGATATHEMFRAHVEAGFTEQQALFYLGCLMQVGLAIQQGGLLPPPQEPGDM